MDASHGMLEHYKEKLATTENLNRALWSQKGELHLVSVHVRATKKITIYVVFFWRTNQLVILLLQTFAQKPSNKKVFCSGVIRHQS